MRIALVSAHHRTHDGSPIAFLQMGGRSVLAWQVDLVLSLGCERIVCLGNQTGPEIDAVKQRIEEKGAHFQSITTLLELVGQVAAGQEIVVLADGVMLDRSQVPNHLHTGRGVVAIPAEQGLSAGFERVDADYAWAGLLVARGDIVERLADFPPDSDMIALLLRLALQARTPLISLGPEVLENGDLFLALDESVLAERAGTLITQSAKRVSWMGPGQAIAARAAQALAPRFLEAGPLVAGGLSAVLVVAGVGTALAGFQALGLGLLSVGVFSRAVQSALKGLKQRLYGESGSEKYSIYINGTIDILLIIALTVPTALREMHEALFLPVILLGIVRLATNLSPERFKPLLSDRILLGIFLVAASYFGFLPEVMGGLALVALAASLFFQSNLR